MADRRYTASMLALACDLHAAGELKPEETAAMLRQSVKQARVLEYLMMRSVVTPALIQDIMRLEGLEP